MAGSARFGRSGFSFTRVGKQTRRHLVRAADYAVELLEGRRLLASTIAITNQALIEGTGATPTNMVFTVTRAGDLSGTVSVGYSTADGTAIAGQDYLAQSGTVTFAPGQSVATIPVPIIGDALDEADETFFVNLSGISGVTGPIASYAARSDLAVGTAPADGAVGDLNGDGRDDLAIVRNVVNGAVAVLLNTTAPGSMTPSFAAPVEFAAGTFPKAVAVGDINGDGRSDLAVAVQGNQAGAVSILLNTTTPGAAVPSFSSAQAPLARTPEGIAARWQIIGPGAANQPAGVTTYSLVVDLTGSSLFNVAGLQATLPAGSTYHQDALGSTTTPNPAFIALFPSLAYDTYVGTTAGFAQAPSVPGKYVGPGAAVVGEGQEFNVSWGAFPSTGPAGGIGLEIARLSVLGGGVPQLIGGEVRTSNDPNTPIPIPQFPPATTVQSTDVAVSDVNGDGRADVVVCSETGIVSVFLNNTAPGAATAAFRPRNEVTVGTAAAKIALGDLNRDGRLDLVASSGSNVIVRLNTTSPGATAATFAPQQDFPAGGTTAGVATGDVNGDGIPDIVVAAPAANLVGILLNQTVSGAASVTFAARQDLAAGPDGVAADLYDMNADGRPDLVVSNRGGNSIVVRMNRASPGSATVNFDAGVPLASGPGGIAVGYADINRDGRPDVAGVNTADTSASVFLNTTTLGAATILPAFPQTPFATGALPHTSALGDINGDGRLDLVAVNQDAFTVSVLLNATAPGATPLYAAKQDFSVQSFPDWVAIADLNRDGRQDLVVANGLSNSISVLLNTTSAGSSTVTFAARQDFGVGVRPRSVVATDLNGDGAADLAVANIDSNTLSFFFNTTLPGATSLSLTARQDVAHSGGPTGLTVADFNLDGRPDLAVADFSGNTASVLLNATALGGTVAAFAARQTYAVNSGPRGIAAADLNGDGRPDLAVANAAAGEVGTTVSLLLNSTSPGAGTPSFSVKQDYTVGTGPIAVTAGDVNLDGRPDLAVANFASNNVSVLLNQTTSGSGTVAFLAQNFAAGSNPIFVATGDLNGDGRPELTSANFSSNTISVFTNTPVVISQVLATGTIQDDDPSPLVSLSSIAGSPLSVRWQPVAITAAAIANDPALANMVCFDLIVTTSTDWISSGVEVTLPGGATFYNNALGGQTAPNPAVFPSNPAVAFDTYVTGPGGFASPPAVLGGYPSAISASFGPSLFSVSWGDLITSAPGQYQIARLTFSRTALATGNVVTDSSRVTQSHPVVVETIIPVPEIYQTRSVAESAGTITIPVFFPNPSGQDILVSASVTGGTATGALDFTGPNSVLIPAGATTGNLTLTIINDLIDEPNETITLVLNDPAGGAAAGTIFQYISITDDDPVPTVRFAASTSSAGEGSGAVNVSVTLSNPSAFEITVPFSLSGGTANSPTDFTLSASPLVIPAGASGGSIVVTIVDDALDEANETVVLALGIPTNGTLGTPASHTFTITDNDAPPAVRFAAATASAGEAAGQFVVTLQLSGVSGLDVTVPVLLGVGGTASTPADFTFSPASVFIPAGSASGTTTITIVDDQLVESDETVVLAVGSPTNATVGSPSQFTLTIQDNDVPPAVSSSQFLYLTAPHRVTFAFTKNVGASLSPVDLELTNLTAGTVVPPASIAVSYAAGTNTATFTFPGVPNGVLADGNYRARLVATGVTDAFGNSLATDVLFDFFHLTADANHDRSVNLGDFSALAANFNRPGDFSQGDFNYSGTVELSDFSLLAAKFNSSLPPALARGPGAAGEVTTRAAARLPALPMRALFSNDRIERAMVAELLS